ncbi:MAG: biotin carboxylase N-terminal domain-containing protein [Roseobacter sp.]
MFNTILIANRGEIACRIMETAQALGVRCVAVYSDADVGAKHVQMADHAIGIGGAAPADSYLRAERIIQAALQSGAEAIHPGYGFLSENPDFVDAVEGAGLVFIGPSSDAIRAMGLKDAAKALMVEAGVPVVPGYHGADQDPHHLAQEAAAMGYPVLIKAVAGGGGKGMRYVETAKEFCDALTSARSEAETAFGNSDVLVEKFISAPRHIEVQIFGDGQKVVHLYERDCSLQRRHQKVIEEAPAPGMTDDVRRAMGAAAVRAAQAIGYSGAGTVEFIVDGSAALHVDGFFFMEMNTRLQVEHPVSEAITGIDLVEWQLRVAAGEALPASQDEISATGHAFEARLYAEDVAAGFLPAIGCLEHLAFPDGARVDAGVRSGDDISPYYDPMIAKIITHGPTRAVALAKLRSALSHSEVAGTLTNLAFLGALCAHEGFKNAQFDTGLIERDVSELTTATSVVANHWVAAGMAALDLVTPGDDVGFSLWQPLTHYLTLTNGEQDTILVVEVIGPNEQRWRVGETSVRAYRHLDQWSLDGKPLPKTHVSDTQITVFADHGIVFNRIDPLQREQTDTAPGNVIVAPMPGLVKMIAAKVGQEVRKGDRLGILEAMKMEHNLQAAADGVVCEVLVQEGDQIAAGAALILLEENQR